MPRRVLTGAVLGIAGIAVVVAALLFFASREGASTDVAPRAAPGAAASGLGSEVLRRGNVELVAGPAQLAAARALAQDIAGPDDGALREAGQAVLVRRGTAGVTARAWHRRLTVAAAADPRLRDFVEFWLGRGAG